VAQVDHVVQTGTKEIVGGHRRVASRTPRKRSQLHRLLGDLTIGNHPAKPAFMRVGGLLQGRPLMLSRLMRRHALPRFGATTGFPLRQR
jgi:hypothetical protein